MTTTEVAPAPRAGVELKKILSAIRIHFSDLDRVNAEAGRVTNKLYVNVYLYVEGLISQGVARSARHGVELLAATLRRGTAGILTHYVCGSYMRANRLSPDSVDHSSVRLAARTGRGIPMAEQIQVVSALKKGESVGAIAKLIFRGKLKSGSASLKRVRRIIKDGRQTKNTIQMEMLACLTLLRNHFKTKGGRLAFCDSKGVILMTVGEETVGDQQ